MADTYLVPKPFRAFAVRSDELEHATDARAPYDRVHLVHIDLLDPSSLASLAAEGYSRVHTESFYDVEYANTTLKDLGIAAPRVADLPGEIADALRMTGVLGSDLGAYQRSVTVRIDYLATCGAGFHNDVGRHWSRCLFWILALDVGNAEFVMPHAGLRLPLKPGDLIVFDQTMAHGLCRPEDGGQALSTSFESGDDCRQIFLTGELCLTDAQWAALDTPWLPVEQHELRGALDLMVAEFDDRSGAIKGLRGLRDCMKRTTCHVDQPED
jgi:hypothetical protein